MGNSIGNINAGLDLPDRAQRYFVMRIGVADQKSASVPRVSYKDRGSRSVTDASGKRNLLPDARTNRKASEWKPVGMGFH